MVWCTCLTLRVEKQQRREQLQQGYMLLCLLQLCYMSRVMQVLEKDPSNVKGLFRRAQAYMVTQDYIEARQDLDLAIKLDPSHRYASQPKFTYHPCIGTGKQLQHSDFRPALQLLYMLGPFSP